MQVLDDGRILIALRLLVEFAGVLGEHVEGDADSAVLEGLLEA